MMTNNKGFTFIEVIIGSSLLLLVIFLGMNFTDVQIGARKTRTTQTMFRYLAIQTASTITGKAEMFPALEVGGANPVKGVYVGCFNNKGEAVPNNTGSREFSILFISQNDLAGEDYISTRCLCASGNSGAMSMHPYEVRFWYPEADTRKIQFAIIDARGILRNHAEWVEENKDSCEKFNTGNPDKWKGYGAGAKFKSRFTIYR
jgi:hypothetical protein